jgi:hypothetical protein
MEAAMSEPERRDGLILGSGHDGKPLTWHMARAPEGAARLGDDTSTGQA